jgi:hypothetical protein
VDGGSRPGSGQFLFGLSMVRIGFRNDEVNGTSVLLGLKVNQRQPTYFQGVVQLHDGSVVGPTFGFSCFGAALIGVFPFHA